MRHGWLGNGGDNGVCDNYSYATTTTAKLHLPGRRHQVPRPAAATAANRSGRHHCGQKQHADEVEVDVILHAAAVHCYAHAVATTFARQGTIQTTQRVGQHRCGLGHLSPKTTAVLKSCHAHAALACTCRFWYARGGCELIATRPAPLMPTLYPMHTTCTSQLPACS